MWKLTRDETNYGIPQRSLLGHSHFVSDVVISSDGQFALSGAWDGSLRLWDLTKWVQGLKRVFGGVDSVKLLTVDGFFLCRGESLTEKQVPFCMKFFVYNR